MAKILSGFQAKGWYDAPDRIWVGTSVESGPVDDRIDDIREVPAAANFLSCELLFGPIPSLGLDGISWVIVGRESGKHLWTGRRRERRALV
jgi:protein gp37